LDEEDMKQLTDLNNIYNSKNPDLNSKFYFLVNSLQEEFKELKECITFKELTMIFGIQDFYKKGTILDILKETSIESVSKKLENQSITTLYNKKMSFKYNFIKFETRVSVNDKIIPMTVNNEEVRVSLATFLKEKYNLIISDENQPIIQCSRNEKVAYLVPEFTGIFFEHVQIVKSISKYLIESLEQTHNLKNFQQDFGIQFKNQLLLRQR
jgi:hypothetical protein